jgi:hypothetical protein
MLHSTEIRPAAGERCRAGADHFGIFGRALGRRGGPRGRGRGPVSRCLDRAAELGVIEALDDRQRTGRDPTIIAEARTWLVALACQKPKALGYWHELWTTRLLAAHARDRRPAAGHPGVARLAQGTVYKILADHAVKPHKSLPSQRRGCAITWRSAIPEFEPKMAEILCIYRQVAVGERGQGAASAAEGTQGSQAIVSYDEKPGIQAIGTTAPDRPPLPGNQPDRDA